MSSNSELTARCPVSQGEPHSFCTPQTPDPLQAPAAEVNDLIWYLTDAVWWDTRYGDGDGYGYGDGDSYGYDYE